MPTPVSDLGPIAAALTRAQNVIMTTHVTPDGDGLGSALALVRFLRSQGKTAKVINCSSMPTDLRWMPREGEFSVWSPTRHAGPVRDADLIVATDLGNSSRLGRMEQPVRRSNALKAVIDHHQYENDLFDMPVIVTEASSSAEVTYDLIRHMGGRITHELAEPLYVGLVSDTGNFAYAATTSRAHRIAAEFLEVGVDTQEIWRKLNCQVPIAKMRFLGDRLSKLELAEEGRIVWTAIDVAMMKSFGIPARDAFEVVNHFLHLKDVEVGLLFMEISHDKTKVSLRSAGRADVCAIARRHTGGGHRFAAGCTVDGRTLEQTVQMIIGEASEALRMAERSP